MSPSVPTEGIIPHLHTMSDIRESKDVGILAMEVYFPSQYVSQVDLEQYDGVSTGKYTIGLGQTKMAFCADREDINSVCLTVLSKLMSNHNISYSSIGRLEVGTETIIDHSKSVKSCLMQLFAESGNHDVEGVDNINACYGGTAALFNTLNWMESTSWDGRNAVVVTGDIALYASGNARPTGGAGAVAMLIGPNAPIVFDRGVRASYMDHAYDFYKPILDSEYPKVDGKLSVECYLKALDRCYQSFRSKVRSRANSNWVGEVDLDMFDYCCFHAPYNKLVQKSWARLLFNDFKESPNSPRFRDVYEQFTSVQPEESYGDAALAKEFFKIDKKGYDMKVEPTTALPKQLGNVYTASLYSGLASLLMQKRPDELHHRRILFFSYGSGLAASMFSATIKGDVSMIVEKLAEVRNRLDQRISSTPDDFVSALKLRECTHSLYPYQPTGSVSHLFPGTYYVDFIDEQYRRKYAVTSDSDAIV